MTKIILKEGFDCELIKKVPHLLMILESYIDYCSFALFLPDSERSAFTI